MIVGKVEIENGPMEKSTDLIRIEVISYSGYKADERPIKIVVGGVLLEVTDVIDRWYGEKFDYFKVKLSSGVKYLIARDRGEDRWYLKGRPHETRSSRH